MAQSNLGSVYLRVSSTQQETLIDQSRAIIEYAKKNNIILDNTRVFGEKVSGADISKQSEFHRCITSLVGPVRNLIVYSVSRLGRSTDLHDIVDTLLNNGVVIHSVKEDYIVKDPKLLHSCIDSSIVELYELKRKIKEANERAIKSGFFIRGKVPIGFQLNTTQGTNGPLKKKYLTIDSRFNTINSIARMTNRKAIANKLRRNNITSKDLAHFKKNKDRCMRLVRNSRRNLNVNNLKKNGTEMDIITNMFDKMYI